MSKTKTSSATALHLELPPEGGSLSVITSLEEDAHYLRVTLDKSDNFKVAAGERLRDLLVNKFANNRNALRDWYEDNVVQGKEHRAWATVEKYLGTVLTHGSQAAEVFADRDEKKRQWDREYKEERKHSTGERTVAPENVNEINAINQQSRRVKSEYELRKEWLSDMNVLWFKGEREWQARWLEDRHLSRRPGFG